MTMNRAIEDRLKTTGVKLRDRPSVVDRVIAEIRARLAQESQPQHSSSEPRRTEDVRS